MEAYEEKLARTLETEEDEEILEEVEEEIKEKPKHKTFKTVTSKP